MAHAVRVHGLRPATVDRIVYTTITMMSVLIVYDGWQHLDVVDVVGVVAGPVLAMFISHVFSASIALQMRSEGVLSVRERMVTVRA